MAIACSYFKKIILSITLISMMGAYARAQVVDNIKYESRQVKLFFVKNMGEDTYKKNEGDSICNPQLSPIEITIKTFPDFMITETLRNLFAARNETLAKISESEVLLNPLKKSGLVVGWVKVPKYNHVVNLQGKISYANDCELQAIKSQIVTTLGQFDAGAEIWLNGSAQNFTCLGLSPAKCKINTSGIDLNSREVLTDPNFIDYNPHVRIY